MPEDTGDLPVSHSYGAGVCLAHSCNVFSTVPDDPLQSSYRDDRAGFEET